MKSKVYCLVFSVFFAASLFLGSDVNAGKMSSGGSSRSSSSRMGSPSWPKSPATSQGNYGNTATKPDQSGKSTGEGYGNTGAKSSGTASSPSAGYGNSAKPGTGLDQSKSSSQMTPLQSRMNGSFSKQESAKAFEDYKAQQDRFKITSAPGGYNPTGRESSTVNSIRTRAGYSWGSDYYARRTVFYDSYGWSAPGYIYYSYPRFGIWDAMMLWFMLDHINDAQYAAMYYNHKDDPGMQQFRQEVDRLSADNAELKAKVVQLDESAKSLEQQGAKPDPSYIPQDAAGVALAADIVQKENQGSSGISLMWLIGIGVLAFIIFRIMRSKR